MDYSVQYVNVEIKFDLTIERNELFVSNVSGFRLIRKYHSKSDRSKYNFNLTYEFSRQEWTPCRLNMKHWEVLGRSIEVRSYPVKYGQNYPYDFEIDLTNVLWGPIVEVNKPHVYHLIWTVDGDRKCRLYISFAHEALYDSYVAYLENLLRSLAVHRIGEFGGAFIALI